MELGNFYTGFGILLVYFTLVWQNIRQGNLIQIEGSKLIISKQSSTASKEQITNQKSDLWNCISNPLSVTIIIISLSGTLAFIKIIYDNIAKLNYNVESIVLFSIAFMHLIISIDLWKSNIQILTMINKLNRLK